MAVTIPLAITLTGNGYFALSATTASAVAEAVPASIGCSRSYSSSRSNSSSRSSISKCSNVATPEQSQPFSYQQRKVKGCPTREPAYQRKRVDPSGLGF